MKFLAFVCCFLTACATGPKPSTAPPLVVRDDDQAPTYNEYRLLKNLSSEDLEKVELTDKNLKLWRSHVLALRLFSKDPAEACPQWQELSQEPRYPLRALVQLRLSLYCGQHSGEKAALSEDEEFILREIWVDKTLLEAKETSSVEDDVHALIEKAKYANHFQDREGLLKQALKLAHSKGSASLVDTVQTVLFRYSPRLAPEPYENPMAVAADHRQWREFKPALKIYRQIIAAADSTDEQKFQALKALRQTYKTAEEKNDYIESTAELAQWTYDRWKQSPKDANFIRRFHDAQMILARTFWTEDRTSDALKTLKRTERWLAGSFPLDELNFIRSRIFEEKKDYATALLFLKKALREKSSTKGLHEKMLWAHGWLQYKNQKYDESSMSFRELADKSTELSDKVRALYWLARSDLKLGSFEKAQEALKKVITEDPLGYYGLLALRELNLKIEPIAVQTDSTPQSVPSLAWPSSVRSLGYLSDWLVAVGESNLAERALNRLSEQLRALEARGGLSGSERDDIWLKLFNRFAQSGSYLPLFSSLSQLKAETREAILKSHPEVIFPQPFLETVQEAASEAQVPSALVYAIMRQESAFNPKARSPVDAYGLMQLMPSIAQTRAKQKNIPFEKATDLFEPEVNIRLGALELKSLLKRYNERLILTISAYNANEKALRGWLRNRFREDPIEFIEEIPYEETRSYVKLVLRNYIFYQRFNAPEAFDFPESCLNLSHKTSGPPPREKEKENLSQ